MSTLRERLEEIIKYDAEWASPDANNCAREARAALAILDTAPPVGKTPALFPHPGWRELFDPNHPDIRQVLP